MMLGVSREYNASLDEYGQSLNRGLFSNQSAFPVLLHP